MPEPQIETPAETKPKRFQCRHIFTDGRRCGSPCLRKPEGSSDPEDFCYFHHTSRRPAPNPRARRSRRSTFTLPLPEDRSAIQLSIGEVLQKIASNDIDPRRAGLLLYGLQIASLNLPRARTSEPERSTTETVEEVTLDPALGTLAPRSEVTEKQEPKSSADLMLDYLRNLDTEPATLPTIQAAAVEPLNANSERTSTSLHGRYHLKSFRVRKFSRLGEPTCQDTCRDKTFTLRSPKIQYSTYN